MLLTMGSYEMLASEKMARRAVLFQGLLDVDRDLTMLFGERSLRASSKARALLTSRAGICDELLQAGYEPWDVPADLKETKVG